MNLKQLHKEFIDKSENQMTFGKLPVKPIESNLPMPIIPMNRWEKKENPSRLVKTYQFHNGVKNRNAFIIELFKFEEEFGHHADMLIYDNSVQLCLSTKGINQISELDKEYAFNANEIFKDVSYYDFSNEQDDV